MTTLTPAMNHAFALLRNDLFQHLDGTESLTSQPEEWADDEIELAGRMIGDLVAVVRSVIAQHTATPTGGCRFCRYHRWPCPTIDAVHRVLRDPDREFVRLVDA